ncbi:MAG TPA: efflux transporter periplasmic adaptor subunit, partial [Thermoanaerobaculia bacterium]|nr:efflux transporter periplasmic adaptor subunit [Thermoanaerobaculia bacterium]
PAAVRPGFLARARMVVEKRKGVLLVPEPALQRGSETPHFVWVLDGETARVRPVEPGERVDGRVVVRKGLAAGDDVVVEGLVRLRDGGPARRAASESGA